ncbi:MAG: threonylcarbamoyl-AMP synthase [Bacteroidales bacterium]|nr:threonylcarbamoyl-AMP synthase [Bacteroidales bacterium]
MMDRNVQETVSALKERKLILYPTDTVWGIGCDATDEEAVKKVFALKKRSEAKSLVLLAADLDMVARYIKEIPQMAIQLVEVNDAPMTIIYPGAMGIAPSAVAQDGTVGIRIPMNDFCVEVIRRFGRPIVSTSANISGQSAPSCFAEISEEIKAGVDYTVDPSLEKTSTGKASQIIKIGLKGEVEIIRA